MLNDTTEFNDGDSTYMAESTGIFCVSGLQIDSEPEIPIVSFSRLDDSVINGLISLFLLTNDC